MYIHVCVSVNIVLERLVTATVNGEERWRGRVGRSGVERKRGGGGVCKCSSRMLSDCYSEWRGGVERKGGVEEEGSGGVVNVVCSKMCVSIIITQV